jgi:lipoprotein-releasing system permease protein
VADAAGNITIINCHLHFLFAWRYFKAKKSTNAINIIAWVSIGGIMIVTTVMVLVLSVFNGFEGLVKSLYSTFYPELKISPVSGKTITLTAEQLQKLRGIGEIKNFSLVIEEKALVQTKSLSFSEAEEINENQTVLYLKGVDDQYRYVTGVSESLIKGVYDIGDTLAPMMIIGNGLERALGVSAENPLDPLIIYIPRRTESETLDPVEGISGDTIRLSAAFAIQQEFDNKYGITNIDFLRRAMKLPADQYSAVEISIRNIDDVDPARKKLKDLLGPQYLIQDKYQQNQSLYSVMNLERWAIYGVLCLILIVGAFTMIGALTMLVLEKQKDIHVLHALGANRRFIQRVFLTEGMLLAFIGGGLGMLLAILLAVLQTKFHTVPLSGGSFLIDYMPVKLKLTDFFLIGGTVFVITLIASWLPSRKAMVKEFTLRSE